MLLGLAALTACGHASGRSPLEGAPPAPDQAPAPHRAPAGPAARILDRPSAHVAAIGTSVFVDGSGPLLISRDRGATFAPWAADPALCVRDFVAARGGGTLYAIAVICSETDVQTNPDHLFRSTDDGATWADLGTTGAMLRGVDARDPRALYADGVCASAGPCRSDDGGATWHALTVPAASPKYASLQGSLFVADDGLYYAPPRDTGYELFRSRDRGASWQVALRDPTRGSVAVGAVLDDGTVLGQNLDGCAFERSVSGGGFTHALEPVECEPGMYVGGRGAVACAVLGDDRIVTSNDHGATWHDVAMPPRGDALRYTCVVDGDRVLVAAGDGLYAAPAPW